MALCLSVSPKKTSTMKIGTYLQFFKEKEISDFNFLTELFQKNNPD